MTNTKAQRAARRLAVEYTAIGALVPHEKNARVHTQRQVNQIAKSVETFGFTSPVLVDAANNVIAGHGRLLAVKQLGWTQVPTIRLEHLTPDQVRALRLADNRLSEVASWDERLLAEQLKELADADLNFDIDVIGFDIADIDLRIQSLDDIGDEPGLEEVGVVNGPAVSELGDVWQLGRHRIVCGDSLKAETYAALLDGTPADMAFTDAPYNVAIASIVGKGKIKHREFEMASGEMSRPEFTSFLTQVHGLMKQSLVPGALIYSCMDWKHLSEIAAAGEANALELKNVCVWNKGCGGMGSLYRSQHEFIFVLKAGTAPHTNNVQLGRYGRNRTNVWDYPGANSFARETSEGNLLESHPTAKPVALVADAILDASERGDRVLDPFLGSGTTIIAAEKTGRVGLGIELDPRYVDVAIRRWERLTSLEAIHAGTGQTFAERTRQRVTCSSVAKGVAA